MTAPTDFAAYAGMVAPQPGSADLIGSTPSAATAADPWSTAAASAGMQSAPAMQGAAAMQPAATAQQMSMYQYAYPYGYAQQGAYMQPQGVDSSAGAAMQAAAASYPWNQVAYGQVSSLGTADGVAASAVPPTMDAAQAQAPMGQMGAAAGAAASTMGAMQAGMSSAMPGYTAGTLPMAGSTPEAWPQPELNPMLSQMASMTGMSPDMMHQMYQHYSMKWSAMQGNAADPAAGSMGAGMPGMMAGSEVPAGGFYAGAGTGGPHQNWKTRICHKWQIGSCPLSSEACRFAHGDHDLHQPGAAMPGAGYGMGGYPGAGMAMGMGRPSRALQPVSSDAKKKTKLCQEWTSSGSCKYGERCLFAHGEKELRPAPTTFQRRPEMHKTKICNRWAANGTCVYGTRCTFAHGEHELQAPGAAMPLTGAVAAAVPAAVAASAGVPSAVVTHVHGASASDGGATEAAAAVPQPLQQQQGMPAMAPEGVVQGGANGNAVPSTSPGVPSGPAAEVVPLALAPVAAAVPTDADPAGLVVGGAVGGKRPREEQDGQVAGSEPKRTASGAVGEDADAAPQPSCSMCARLWHAGRTTVIDSIMTLQNPSAVKLGCMTVASAARVDQLWDGGHCTPTQMLEWVRQADVPVMDLVNMLHILVYHVHDGVQHPDPATVDRYMSMGLPKDLAEFVWMALQSADGSREGKAEMPDYLRVVEVAKTLFGVGDDTYFAVNNALATIMTGI